MTQTEERNRKSTVEILARDQDEMKILEAALVIWYVLDKTSSFLGQTYKDAACDIFVFLFSP